MMFYYKVHKSGNDTLLAVCDDDIAGKTFSEGGLHLQIKEQFYCGAQAGEEIIKMFKTATIINIAGKRIVALAEKNGWLSGKIISIKGVPHAQIIKI